MHTDHLGAGACVGGLPPDCDDADSCTVDSCDPASGCAHESICCDEPSPRSMGFYLRMCDPEAPPQPNPLSDADVLCVNDTCDFAAVASVADICAVLTSRVDPCARAQLQFMALVLNVCRGQICVGDPVELHCSDQVTVGAAMAEVDALLCGGSPGEAACADAACESWEINTGHAINVDTLVLEKMGETGIRLSWGEPLHDPAKGIVAYHVWRKTAGGSWELAAEIDASQPRTWTDATGLGV